MTFISEIQRIATTRSRKIFKLEPRRIRRQRQRNLIKKLKAV